LSIGIIVYSRTGNTLSVAQKLKKRLSTAGNTVTLQRLEILGPVSLSVTRVELKTVPPIDQYDVVVFATSVQGGVPAPAMKGYLEQLDSLVGKQVACLVTGFFPFAEWGRNQTIAQMIEICESKGATVRGSGSVGWLSLRRKQQIKDLVDNLSIVFTS
jgi:flavodoxin